MPKGVYLRRGGLRDFVQELLEDRPNLTIAEIVWERWGDHPDGGPLYAHDQVWRVLKQLHAIRRCTYALP